VLIWSVDNVNSTTSGAETGIHNRIINGDKRIDQRNNGAVVTNSNGYNIDRWADNYTGSGRYSAQQVTTAPAGFASSLLHTITTAVSPAVSDVYQILQLIEAYNVGDLNFGTASAATVTVSFWVRSSVTGTYAVSINNFLVGTAKKGYLTTYTVNVANTWEYKTLMIPGDTAGTWAANTNAAGLTVVFDLGSGSNHNTTAGSWQTGTATNDLRRTAGSVSLISTAGATFYLTGVQIEKGATATPFDFRPIGMELALCQRYYQVMQNIGATGYGATGTPLDFRYNLLVNMRSAPTVVGDTDAGSTNMTTPAILPHTSSSTRVTGQVTTTGNFTLYRTAGLLAEL